jgi:type IV secretion system protein TrbI
MEDIQNNASEPTLSTRITDPKGVIRRSLKMMVYLGAALVLIVASILSSHSTKAGSKTPPKGTPPQPFVQDNTASNVQDLKTQVASEKQKEQQDAAATASLAAAQGLTPTQQASAAMYGPTGQSQTMACVPGQPCAPSYPQPYPQNQQPGVQPQLSADQQQEQQLVGKERELAFSSRFASNLAYSHSEQEQKQQQQSAAPMMPAGLPNPYAAALPTGQQTNLVPGRAAGEQPTAEEKRAPEVNLDSAVGQPYVIFEGLTLDTVLMNRLDGDAAGPVKVLVSNPVYSHDHQHVLIPDGTIVLGEARKIGSTGFGQQRRMAVVFHRMIMPDGYSVDLDQFHGLDQIGEEGLKDKVNNHYLQIFGTSIALGVIAGAGQITSGGNSLNSSGSQAYTNGAASGVSQSATAVLDKFIQIPPTITIREGHRIKVYFTQDMLLPAYTNHTIPQTF